MSDMPQEIALYQKVKNEAARKRLNIKAAFFWCTSKKESLAQSRMALAMDDAGYNDEDFAKAIRVNLPVVDDLPDEGMFSTTFCDRYQLGEDGMTFQLIPGAEPLPPTGEKIVEGSDTTIVDGVDTQTGEIVGVDNAGSVDETVIVTVDNGRVIDESNDEKSTYSLPLLPFNLQLLAQLSSEDNFISTISWEQRCALATLEMDTDNSYVQNLLLAASQHAELKKLSLPHLWKYTDGMKRVFQQEKRHELATMLKFTKLWIDTEYIDRGILVREWSAGNRISSVQRTPSGANAGGGNKKDRLTPLTPIAQECEIAYGLLARKFEFNIYNVPMEIDAQANTMLNKRDDAEFVATVELFRSIPGGLDFSRACNIATVKTTPEGLWQSPFRHREHLNRVMTETDHANPDPLVVDIACGRSSMTMPMSKQQSDEEALAKFGMDEAENEPDFSHENVGKLLAADRGEFVEGISNPNDPKWVDGGQVKTASNEGEKTEVETFDDVQSQEADIEEKQTGDALPSGENCEGKNAEKTTVELTPSEILAAHAPGLANQKSTDPGQNTDGTNQTKPVADQIEPHSPEIKPEPQQEWPTIFEPGRYENVPNDVYHAANGISSTMLKDVRISPMFYCGRHVTKTIPRTQNDAMLRGTIVHGLVLEPEKFEKEFALPAEMPKEVVSTSGDLVSIIKDYNAGLPALMTPDELKAWIEAYNNDLTPPLSLSGNSEETGLLYMSLPEEFQRLPADAKQTATQQKGCIKEYNASLPPLLKTSGTREQLLDQIATVAPGMAAKERAKFVPYNASGTKEQLTEIVRAIRPDVVTADDWHKQQEEASAGKIMISLDMYEQAKNISAALQAHPSASRLLNHPARQSEISYFGFDEETGLEIRVRPDLEIQLPQLRIGGDLKTVSMGYVKQDQLRARLHREIIERDYHLSAAMYCDTANLDQFFWIFVCRDEGYHWIAVVEASVEELELGRLEYRRALRTINECTATGNWPAPITDDYTDELNDFDLRRLEALSAA
jgi:exodeoxyribonuclease VIII